MTKASTSKNSPVHAAIYARISSDRDDTRIGVEDQVRLSRRLCEDRGWDVADIYTDNDISAADPNKRRPQYERLLADIKACRVNAVVVSAEDRLHRRPHELEGFVTACDVAGLTRLASVGGDTDLNDPDALLMLRLKGAMAAREVEVTRRRIQRRKADMAERGQFSGGSSRAFGYEKDGVTIRKSEAAEIRWAMKHILNGGTIYAVRKRWMDKGIATPTDRRAVDGRPNWAAQTVTKILSGPRIAGLRQHRGEVVGEAVWPPIVDRKTWEAVRAVLSDPRRQQKPASRTYPLRGVLTCSECGRKLAAMPRNHKGEKPKRLYGCRKDAGGCGKVYITADPVESYVVPMLAVIASSDVTQSMLDAEHEANADALRTAVTERASVQAQMDGLEDKWARGTLSERAYVRNRKAIQSELDALDARSASLRGSSALSDVGPGLAANWAKLGADEQRSVFLALVSEIRVFPTANMAKRYNNRMNPERLTFCWRTAGLAKAADVADVPENFDTPDRAKFLAAVALATNAADADDFELPAVVADFVSSAIG